MSDIFRIKTVHGDEMELHLNHFGHIHLNVDNIEVNEDPDFGGTEFYSCSISLDKDRAIKLRDKLNELIDIMYPYSGHQHMLDQIKNKAK